MSRCDIVEALFKTAAEEHRKRRPAIFPGCEFLLFTWCIVDRHFQDFTASLRNTSSNLRLNLEAASFHGQRAGQGAGKQFIASLHIMNVAAIQDIRHSSQETVT